MPCYIRYAISASLKFTLSGSRSQCKMAKEISDVVVATKSKHHTSCSVKNGLEASLKIGRKTSKYEVAEGLPYQGGLLGDVMVRASYL